MDNLEKLRVLLPHWLSHNASHGREFAQWADLLAGSDRELAGLLRQAAESLQAADASLRLALQRAGSADPDQEPQHHHHHHHNLPG